MRNRILSLGTSARAWMLNLDEIGYSSLRQPLPASLRVVRP